MNEQMIPVPSLLFSENERWSLLNAVDFSQTTLNLVPSIFYPKIRVIPYLSGQ